MTFKRAVFISGLIGLMYLLLFSFTYKALETKSVYSLFSSFMPTYENVDGNIGLTEKPFTKISDENYEIMDAAHYAYIKKNSYEIDKQNIETQYNFAFFPLFPIIWRFFSNIGIVTLNFFFFIASILILAYVFCKNSIIKGTLISIALPTLTVFILPYTEGLFLFCISIALLGYKKENKYLYFTGLLLASITRPVFLLFISTAIATCIYGFLKGKKIDFKFLALTITPFIIGTFSVALYQSQFHNESLFTFITAQQHWGTFFRIPNTINDWSNEGYGMNSWALAFCLIFGIAIILFNFFKKQKEEVSYSFWYYFSWIYLVATCCYVILFQGGCLHSLYRYTLCSPFIFIILFHHIENNNPISNKFKILLFSVFLFAIVFFLKNVNYAPNWDFSKTGFILLMLNLFAFLIYNSFKEKYFYFSYALLILMGLIWNTYLYNMFFSKAWIFL